jgi:hypothetical protein
MIIPFILIWSIWFGVIIILSRYNAYLTKEIKKLKNEIDGTDS